MPVPIIKSGSFAKRRTGFISVKLLWLAGSAMFIVAMALPFIQRKQQILQIQTAIDREDLSAARRSLEEFLESHPNDAEAIYLLGSAARRQGDLITFRNCMETATTKDWPKSAIDFQYQLLNVQLGKGDQALQQELLAKGDGSPQISDSVAAQIYQAIAYGHLATYRLKEAWEASEYWLQWQPNSIAAHLLKADIYERIGDPTQAIEQFRSILKIDPSQPAARAQLGRGLLEQNQVEDALTLFEGLVQENIASPKVQIDYADALLRLGRTAEAKRALQGAFSLGLGRDERARASALRGQISMDEGNWEAAAADFLVAIEIAPDRTQTYFLLSTTLNRLEQPTLAEQYRLQGEKLQASATENFQKIRNVLAQILDRPTDPELRTNVGRMMIEQGKVAEGLRWVETALQYDPKYTPALDVIRQFSAANPG